MNRLFGKSGKETAAEYRHCPTCNTELVLRQFQSGPQMGEVFYGCPTCRQRWPLDDQPQ